MPFGLTDPTTALSFSTMPIEELSQTHRDLVAAQREAEHWHRLVSARIDLAVASVADLEEPHPLPEEVICGTPCTPPSGLSDLLGIPRSEDRLAETGLLLRLRHALADLETYGRTLDALADEAGRVLGARVGSVRLTA
ncbi:hypothetical protein ACIB24_04345 [Spongisporangium articulatum]|uniref:Uncharacterized protein n=1 Tax=Spongisporangium articulatum TaxID=3362603 RepID=A0ABW8AJX0_9ACTN